MAKIDAFFKLMHDQGASDLHLASGSQPILRIRGEMERVKYQELNNDDLKAMLYEIAPEDKIKVFEETGGFEKRTTPPASAYPRSTPPGLVSHDTSAFADSFAV